MRPYLTLLRLPYQFQLGPIFGWGFLLSGGEFASWPQFARFLLVFLAFHIGAFGGLTALNSHYDRDDGPIGGLKKPPPPPRHLLAFSWLVQLSGLLVLLPLDWRLITIYAAIVLLALGYSHPRTRWKGNPWRSLIVVAAGQGILDFAAGALTPLQATWSTSAWLGMLGATLLVCGHYPLTQLYQLKDDTKRGDQTLALTLTEYSGRRFVFVWATFFVIAGFIFNAAALFTFGAKTESAVMLILSALPVLYLYRWQQRAADADEDFRRVHLFLGGMAFAFSCYILLRLMF